MPQPRPDKLRNCPGCEHPFTAVAGTISQCPACGRLALFNDHGQTVEFEREGLRQEAAQDPVSLPAGQHSPATGAGAAASGPRSPALFERFLRSLIVRWRPSQIALEQWLIDYWPASLFTFTRHDRWQLRASQRGQFGITELCDARLAKFLASRAEAVSLDSLATLSVPVANQLARSRHSVYLRGLITLDPETAGVLARHSGQTLALDGLVTLPDEVARALSRHRGRGLSLGGLSHLDAGTAEILAEYRGRLALNGLDALTPVAAGGLADHRGASLSLAGIRQLPTEVALALAAYEGDLYLEGLPELAGDLPRAFEAFAGKIKLKFYEIRRRQKRGVAEDHADSYSLVVLAAVALIGVLALLTLLADALE